MKFHIVSQRENIRKIAFLYDLEVDEIKKENRHIRDWSNLVAGTKLKIPVISESVNQAINEFDPFIEEYYPKLDLNNKIEEDKDFEELIYKKSNDTSDEEIIEVNSPIEKEEKDENNYKEDINEIRKDQKIDNCEIDCKKEENKDKKEVIEEIEQYEKYLKESRLVYPNYYPQYSYMFPYRQIVYVIRK